LNDQFWLEPPCDYAPLVVPFTPPNGIGMGVFSPTPTHRPNVKCEIRVQLVPGAEPGAPHRTITVLRLDDAQSAIRHSARLWDHTVTDWRWTAEDGKVLKQMPVVHEVGHLLRLFHPGVGIVPGCTTKDNSQPKCYCVDGWCAELMGAGMTITDRLAAPWQKSMEDHTGVKANRWRVLRADHPPRLISVVNSICAGKVSLGIAATTFAG
jgi:hypothetical protein